MGKTGRPPLFDEDRASIMLNALQAGAYMETAAALAGIAKSTFYDWLRRGARARGAIDAGTLDVDDPDHELDVQLAEFSDAVRKALAQAEVDMLLVVNKAARGDEDHSPQWQAAAWRLERKNPNRWGRRDVSVNIDAPPDPVPEDDERGGNGGVELFDRIAGYEALFGEGGEGSPGADDEGSDDEPPAPVSRIGKGPGSSGPRGAGASR